MKSTPARPNQSSEKEKVSGQTYRLPIWNGIFEHCSKIKDAIWLLLLYINWTTEEVEPGEQTVQSSELGGDAGLEGIVRGGIVVSDGITAKEIPGTRRETTLRWRERLALNGFIRQDRKNYGYVIRVLKSKKWDADGAEGTFRIPVSTGILDHYERLKSSIWLLFWYIDKTTKEENGEGLVLGGKPVLDSVAAGVLGVSTWVIAGWRENLERHRYICARRTPYGHVISVAKSKKWVGKKPSKMSQNSESQFYKNCESLTGKVQNSTSRMCEFAKSDVPFSKVRCANSQSQMYKNLGNKEDIGVDSKGTGKGQNSACRPELHSKGGEDPSLRPTPLKPSNQENHKKEPSRAPVLTERERRLQGFGKFMDGIGVGSQFPDTPAVRFLKDLFVMEPGLSPRQRLYALLEQGRIYRFNIPPELLAAKRGLDEAWRKEKERSAA